MSIIILYRKNPLRVYRCIGNIPAKSEIPKASPCPGGRKWRFFGGQEIPVRSKLPGHNGMQKR